jgi:hypothetical protein
MFTKRVDIDALCARAEALCRRVAPRENDGRPGREKMVHQNEVPFFTAEALPDIDALCSRAEALCRQIAPKDLAGAAIYVLPQSRLPDHLGGKSIYEGLTSPSLDLYLKDVIGPAWRGRGPCLLVNDTIFGGGMDAVDIETAFLGVTLHELAHIVGWPAAYCDRPAADPVRVQFEALCLGRAISKPPPAVEKAPPFEHHGARFIRVALHLWHRARAAGVYLAPSQLCAGPNYGLSHANRYRGALGNEPVRLADMSIRDIAATEYPKAFCRQWAADVAHWHTKCSLSIWKGVFHHAYRNLTRTGRPQAAQAADSRVP